MHFSKIYDLTLEYRKLEIHRFTEDCKQKYIIRETNRFYSNTNSAFFIFCGWIIGKQLDWSFIGDHDRYCACHMLGWIIRAF